MKSQGAAARFGLVLVNLDKATRGGQKMNKRWKNTNEYVMCHRIIELAHVVVENHTPPPKPS